MSDQSHGRRTFLCGAALAGLAGSPLLSACGDTSDSGESGSDTASPGGPQELGGPDAVPVGEARLFLDQRVIVARPAKDTYRGYTVKCTHQGCTINKVEKNVAMCPCHGSRFDAMTGKVEHGPAKVPLPSVRVRVQDGKLVAG